MQYSPSKRRKTSPTTVIPVSASDQDNERPRHNGIRKSAQRLSYMSPTKSSLARFNPNLLPRFGSVEVQGPANWGKGAASTRAMTADYVPSTAAEAPIDSNIYHAVQSEYLPNGDSRREADDGMPDIQDTPSKLPQSIIARNPKDSVGNLQRTPTLDRVRHYTDDEPSLPSTPSQLGLEPPSEKPRGLLFQSPRRTPRRRKGLEVHPSPLQSRFSSLQTTALPRDDVVPALGPRTYIGGTPSPAPGGSLHRLEARLQALQDELTIGSFMSGWRKDDSKSKRRLAKQKRDVGKDCRTILHSNESKIDGLASRTRFPLETDNAEPQKAVRSMTSRLADFGLFLPKPQARVGSTTAKAITKPPSDSTGDTLPTIDMRRLDIVSSRDRENLLVRQDCKIVAPDGTKIARLLLSVDPLNQVASRIVIVESAPWMTSELSPWLLRMPGDKTPMILGSALRRYIECATLRAYCWSDCHERQPHLLQAEEKSEILSKDLGRQSIQLARSCAKLVVQWLIAINDEGAIDSKISFNASFPNSWHQNDSGGDLGKINEAFVGLAKDVGVTEALRTMIRIIFPP